MRWEDALDWVDQFLDYQPHYYDNGATCGDCGVTRLVGGGGPCPGPPPDPDRKAGEMI